MPTVLSFSEVGGHTVNEDAFCVQPHPLDADCWLCFVADGQARRSGGGPAAQVACRSALAAVVPLSPKKLIDASIWPKIIQQADQAVAADPRAGFTTLIGLCVFQNCIVGASSGDSAAMLFSGSRATELTGGQHKNPPVGSGAAITVPFAAAASNPWSVLVMSDGVWKYVGWDRISSIVCTERSAALVDCLKEAARLPGSGTFQDDFTLVLLEDGV